MFVHTAEEPGTPVDAEAPERELRALLRILAAVAGAQALEDVLDVVAEQARVALGVCTVSVSRWDRPRGVLQTLVNVGDLAAGEARVPDAELYPLDLFPRAFELLSRGRPHVSHIDDPDVDPQERLLLAALGKRSAMAVPIVSAGRTWGEMYATLGPAEDPDGTARGTGGRRFGPHDLRFMAAVAGQVSTAITRAEVFSRISRFAFEDPLTGLANRRALEERLAARIEVALESGGDVVLVLCDLDGLKDTNDLEGHAAGDDRLVMAAEALRAAADARPGAFAARIGGDEFCLLLEDAGVEEGQRVAEELGARLGASGAPRATLSSGVAALGLGPRDATELFRLADAAQYRAKRGGPGRVCVAGAEMPGLEALRPERRGARDARHGPFERLVAETVELLDGELAHAATFDRIAAVTDACARTVGAESWSLSRVRPGTDLLETLLTADPGALGGSATRRFSFPGDVYPLADFPATRAVLDDGGTLLMSVDDPGPTSGEREMMAERGWERLLSVAVPDAGETTLVEVFADAGSGSLARLAPFARVLLAQAAKA